MSITVNLCTSSSPKEALTKTLTTGTNYNCVLKENTSILKPVFIISTSDNLTGYNYMDIRDFNRYYFIDDIRNIRNNMWEISAHVDVLTTYATAIKNNRAVIRRQQNKFNLYLNDPEYKTYNTELVQTKKFASSGGLNKTLHYILVVNGSAAASVSKILKESEEVNEDDNKPGA